MPAILFGSISTLADTSELQRQAFNDAFSAHGLRLAVVARGLPSMLGSNGGAQRIADYAASHGRRRRRRGRTRQEVADLPGTARLLDGDPAQRRGRRVEEAKRSGQKLGPSPPRPRTTSTHCCRR